MPSVLSASPVTVWLPYAGALPFLCCALLLVAGIDSLPMLGSVYQVLTVYALVIATFMAGSYWGIHLSLGRQGMNLAVVSNILAIVLWFVFLSLGGYWLLFFCAIFFLLLLCIDFKLAREGLLTQTYWKTRKIVSAVVASSLVVAGLSVLAS